MNKDLIKKNTTLIFLILVLALFLRLPLINSSFWLDEAAQALEIMRPLSQQLEISKDFQPPLLHLILHLAQYLNHSEWYLRTIGALIPALITIYATYLIGKKILGEKIALVAALLIATSPFHIFYSQELRPYSLPVAIAAISWLTLLSNFKKEKIKWLSYIFITSLGFYASYLYPFLFFSQIIYGLIIYKNKKELWSFLFASLASIILFLPWVPKLIEQIKVGQALRLSLPGWDQVVSIPQLKALPLTLGKFFFGILDLRFDTPFIAASLIVCLFFVYLILKIILPKNIKQRGENYLFKIDNKLLLLIIWFFVPLLAVWLFSFILPILRPKRVLFLMPAFYLLISASLKIYKHKKVAGVFISLVLLINIYGLISYWTNPKLQRENWKELIQQIQTGFNSKNTIIIFAFEDDLAPWQYYADPTWPTLSSKKTLQTDEDYFELTKELDVFQTYENVLLFDYLRDLTDPHDMLTTMIRSYGFSELYSIDYPNIGPVRVSKKNVKFQP